jgi:hypothetical protein
MTVLLQLFLRRQEGFVVMVDAASQMAGIKAGKIIIK